MPHGHERKPSDRFRWTQIFVLRELLGPCGFGKGECHFEVEGHIAWVWLGNDQYSLI